MAFRIHSSESTAGLLEEIGGFRLEFRGITEIKVRSFHRKKIEFKKIEFYRAEEIIKPIGFREKMGLIKNYLIRLYPTVIMGKKKQFSHRRLSAFFLFSSLDKELVRLVEERKARELEAEKAQAAATTTNNNIQVKPIIETIPTTQPAAANASSASDTMNINDKIDDLLRFTPPPSNQPTSRASNPVNTNDLPAKLQQQMNGPTRKSTKAKW